MIFEDDKYIVTVEELDSNYMFYMREFLGNQNATTSIPIALVEWKNKLTGEIDNLLSDIYVSKEEFYIESKIGKVKYGVI